MFLAESQIDYEKGEYHLSKNALINENLSYVKSIVCRMAGHLPSCVEIDDLINSGIIGLIEAAEHYNPDKNIKFRTYAAFRIRGAILTELRSRDFLSRSTRQKRRELEAAYLKLEQELCREANDEEVAEELGIDLDEFYKIKKMTSVSFISFDEIGLYSNEQKKDMMSFLTDGRNVYNASSVARIKETEEAVAREIEHLPEKEQIVISLYYWDELTMKEIGNVLSLTESRVSQIHSNAIFHLRVRLRKNNIIED